jgi:DnaK suppressor protein
MPSKAAAKVTKKALPKLSRSEKTAYKKKLLEAKNQIIRKIGQTFSESNEIETDVAQDLADKAESSYTKEFLLSLSDTERRQLLQIDDAIRTLDKGSYGLCQNCGKAISKKRLEALPWATHCIDCQQKIETER